MLRNKTKIIFVELKNYSMCLKRMIQLVQLAQHEFKRPEFDYCNEDFFFNSLCFYDHMRTMLSKTFFFVVNFVFLNILLCFVFNLQVQFALKCSQFYFLIKVKWLKIQFGNLCRVILKFMFLRSIKVFFNRIIHIFKFDFSGRT